MGDYNDAFLRNNAAGGPANVQSRVKAQARTNVLQLKLIGQSHPTGLTNNLLKLFEPRPPLEFKPPPEKNKCPPYTGMAQYVPNFAEPSDAEYAPPVQKGETPTEKRARVHLLRLEEGAKRAAEELEKYDPSNDPNISGDPYKTLFVARLNYETTESRIKREFEAYGPIKRVGIIRVSQSGTQFCIWLGKIDEVFVSSCNLCLCVASVVPSFHNKVIHICLIAVFKGKKKWNYVLYCITNIMFWSLWQGD
ncbi:hypothetical protein DCAR_0729779 [Daucus carota subsp. sativus]|uniref:Uncharacterized protein n=1 Tax=Daucus carota subsp. sativus TaxID=79200 RepID=A0AAF1BAW1_DAUCS|nr:hypothetical protein DCAR_0729779 [Daucus carota subsp. sativus]